MLNPTMKLELQINNNAYVPVRIGKQQLTVDGKIESTKTSPTNAFGDNLKVAILSLVYPVGSIYTSFNSTAPATLFGFGTWAQITDRFLYCANSSGSTGGSSTHNHHYGIKYGGWYNQIRGLNENDNIQLLNEGS